MSAELDKFVRRHVANFISDIQTSWNIDPAVIAAVEAKLKHTVKVTLAINCLSGSWCGKSEHDAFLAQIPENLSFAIILALRGHLNAAQVLVRQSVELFFKHLYFSTHPVEFQWIQQDDGIREFGFQRLYEYATRLPEFQKLGEATKCLEALSCGFSDASRYVHSHSVKFLGSSTLVKTKSDIIDAFTATISLIDRVAPAVVFLLAVYYYDQFSGLSSTEQSLSQLAFTGSQRSAFNVWKRHRALKST